MNVENFNSGWYTIVNSKGFVLILASNINPIKITTMGLVISS